VAAIVAISGKYGVFCAQALHRWRPKVACPVVVIRQGTYCSFDPAEGDYIEQVTAGRPFCLSIGTTRSYKQFDHFIRAVIHLQRRKAAEMGVVVGPLTTDWLSSVKKFYPVQVLPGGMVGLGPVLFVGPSMYTGNWYSRAQCCLCTSTSYEGIPGALREAMLVRCLTGSYNIGSIAELMRGGKCGVVSPLGDPTRLADGVAKLLRDTMSKRKMVAGAHAHVLDCFSAGEHCKQSEALLRDILETT
jgi:glycosyltransferase involved in cell wall biosynthesis